MDVSPKEKSSISVNLSRSTTTRLLRYPLRSRTKLKEERPPLGDSSNSSAPRSRGEFNLNNFQDGVISSAFMIRFLVASLIFASLAKRNGFKSER